MVTNYIYHHEILERLLFRFSKKWLGGYNIVEAIQNANSVNLDGVYAIINYLGEGSTELEEVHKTLCEYSSLLTQMNKERIQGSISIKPTQLGLDISYEICLKRIKKLVDITSRFNYFVWIDMESYSHVDDTLSIYLDIFQNYSNVGVALQAYLRRSRSDLIHLIEHRSNIRLVKGAYHNSRKIAYQSKNEIKANFLTLLDISFKENHKAVLAVATHDTQLINRAQSLCNEYLETLKYIQFQFLKGIKCELRNQLLANCYQVCEYIPYGKTWLPFVLRRLKERKRELIYLSASLIK